jgi:hypothetical protein
MLGRGTSRPLVAFLGELMHPQSITTIANAEAYYSGRMLDLTSLRVQTVDEVVSFVLHPVLEVRQMALVAACQLLSPSSAWIANVTHRSASKLLTVVIDEIIYDAHETHAVKAVAFEVLSRCVTLCRAAAENGNVKGGGGDDPDPEGPPKWTTAIEEAVWEAANSLCRTSVCVKILPTWSDPLVAVLTNLINPFVVRSPSSYSLLAFLCYSTRVFCGC